MNEAPVFGIDRHRIRSDGRGITTLVAFMGCPLHCKYCINDRCHASMGACHDGLFLRFSPQLLYDKVKIDDLYFRATGGGVTFGGGEPGLYSGFIADFRGLCGDVWTLSVETSLNIPLDNLKILAGVTDCFIVDVKDMNPLIYEAYTGMRNDLVLNNLRYIADVGRAGDTTVRVPHICGYNGLSDIDESIGILAGWGYSDFDIFTYVIPNEKSDE